MVKELLSDERLAGHRHFGFKLYKNSQGSRVLACDANGSVTFQAIGIFIIQSSGYRQGMILAPKPAA